MCKCERLTCCIGYWLCVWACECAVSEKVRLLHCRFAAVDVCYAVVTAVNAKWCSCTA